MPDDATQPAPGSLTARIVARIDDIAAAEWDACAGPDNPFVSHAFLSALEESGSVGPQSTGWLPQHVAINDSDGRLLACAPAYIKLHSYGEYVFDHGWADAFERAGGRYYPKLQICVPFTPAPGPRLLVRPGEDVAGLRQAMIATLTEFCEQAGLSSLHITFPSEAEYELAGDIGLIQRIGQQFHWHNDGYASFEDFLAALNSRKRKQIRKERREAQAGGVTLRAYSGAELKPEHWDAFYRFYENTSDRKWGSAYLTRDFFQLLGERMGDRVVLFLGEEEGHEGTGAYVCGALNLAGTDTLYGRNWGCEEHVKFLHFEACYYRAIDWAIEYGFKRVEAGAQGPHKIQRGYLPTPTYSAHWIAHPGLRDAVDKAMRRERPAVLAEIDALTAEYSPYRQEGEG
ncbi:MAG: GNAT family N-acetyltransferase [Alphaproteobacteria bacterium]|nr:GNAT family N-acetyltransferase [Alphaproteobacteria bacterium]MBU0797825.1 GNAT family N-acetyltransferase [Alphaproteobacteria bacterium]MBU0886097.1 GNAT family N-acetyltransferase [Alphaproteobacteria bacterium]MBU1814583.1 GNAT family N-acetyltransferase [Alphaproteobacteria bacterium]